jgi:hypothetical protein
LRTISNVFGNSGRQALEKIMQMIMFILKVFIWSVLVKQLLKPFWQLFFWNSLESLWNIILALFGDDDVCSR